MPNDWIIDVLADLKAFAELNGLKATAAGLEDASLLALAELASLDARRPGGRVLLAQPGHDGEAANVTPLFAGHILA